MRRRDPAPRPLSARLLVIGVAVVAMLGAIVAVERLANRAPATAEPPDAFLALPQEPIAYEADVFLTHEATIDGPDVRRRASAHPRSLATYRRLRAFPGAPPRVPHGLTSAELRATSCNTCHERGGYSQRFGAYAPLTPHPELPACLQCHVVDAVVTGTSLPIAPDDRCRQCHAPGMQASSAPALDWESAPWPQVRRPAIEGDPPPIPHHLEFRGNCLACHMGPNAVAEIRTTHPERTSCRQCHVRLDDAVPEYVRPAVAVRAGSGGAP